VNEYRAKNHKVSNALTTHADGVANVHQQSGAAEPPRKVPAQRRAGKTKDQAMPPTIIIAPVRQQTRESDANHSFLAPGQRYRTHDHGEAYTVSQLRRDDLGLLHVTLRSGRGREHSAFAAQVETAISMGDLLPVATEESLLRC
jgi:hypothetical protein